MRRLECAHNVSGAKHGAKRTKQDSDPTEGRDTAIENISKNEDESVPLCNILERSVHIRYSNHWIRNSRTYDSDSSCRTKPHIKHHDCE